MRSVDKYNQLKNIILNAKKIVVITGAGISCPPPTSIKDFRSKDGLYSKGNKYNVPTEYLLSHEFFVENTKDFFEFYKDNFIYKDVPYNDAHKFFADLEKEKDVTIITQNIDGLHTKAGSKSVLELHGNSNRNYCTMCKKMYDLDEMDFSDIPICSCGGIVKPDVVLYGESLNGTLLSKARDSIRNADTLIVVGSSLTVYPVAGFVKEFKGENCIIINKQETPFDEIADIVINDDIIDVINKMKTNKKR